MELKRLIIYGQVYHLLNNPHSTESNYIIRIPNNVRLDNNPWEIVLLNLLPMLKSY